jgi:hypothetical protein
MSLAEFEDICIICSEWKMGGVFDDVILEGLNSLSNDSLTFKLTSHTNRLGEVTESKILNTKRDLLLV